MSHIGETIPTTTSEDKNVTTNGIITPDKANQENYNSDGIITLDQARQESYPKDKDVIANPSGDIKDSNTGQITTPDGETYTPEPKQNDLTLNEYEEIEHKVKTDSVVTPEGKRIYRQPTGKDNTGAAHDLESEQWMETRHSKEAPETDTFVSAKEIDTEDKTQEPEQKQYYGENYENLIKKVDSLDEYMKGDEEKKRFAENTTKGRTESPNILDPDDAKSTASYTDDSVYVKKYREGKENSDIEENTATNQGYTPEETRVEEDETPVNDVETPVEDVDTTVEEVETPVEEVETPVEEVETPVEEVETPVEEVDTTVEEVDTPVEEVDTPIDEVETPVEDVDTTVEEVETTVEVEASVEDAVRTTEQEDLKEALGTKDLVALMNAITELNTSIVELKKVFEGNDAILNSVEKLSITVNNFGNQVIVNNGEIQIGTQTNIDVQGDGNETNVNINKQLAPEETSTTQPEEDNFENIPEETSLQDLEEQKAELEERLRDPNLTEEQYNTINTTIGRIENVINISVNGAEDVELTDAEKEERLAEKEDAAEDFLGEELTDQDKSDLKEAEESDKGFFAQIKRVFKGSGWKKFITEGAKRFGANLAISSAVGGTVALLGPVGATVVGGAMVAMGGVTLYKGLKMVKAEAKASGRSVKEVWQDKDFRRGVLHGTLTSGLGRVTTMAVSGLIPGVGGFLGASVPALASAAIGTGLEHGVEFFAERDFQKKEKDFMDKLSSNFNYRNYRMMNEEGYLISGTEIEGTKTLNIKGISDNLRNLESIKDKDRTDFAIKSGVATLLELYNQTKDDRYRYIEYTDGKETLQLDLTEIGLQEIQGESTDDYPLLEFEPSIDAYIDRINTQQLAEKIETGWASIENKDIEDIGLRIIQNIAGLEAAEVDSVLSEEKKLYYEKVRYMCGWRMGTCIVNAGSAIGAGLTMMGQGIAASRENARNRQAVDQEVEREIEQIKSELGDDEAGVEIMQTENGEKVYAIDIDNDSNVDLYRTESGEIYSTSILGAERAFEMNNGFNQGDISVTPLANSQTGIAGTIVNNSTGEVLGVAVDGGNGTWTTMSVSELETPLSASIAGTNQLANINISDVQSNGIATINIDGNTYQTNLSTLNDIPGFAGTEGVPGAGTVNIETGDSMPVILRKALQDASQSNERLAEVFANDPHAMERKLYQGNRLQTDATIRNEANLTNPLRVDNNEGVFNYSNSNQVMQYLQELNDGNPVSLPSGVPASPGQPGYNLGFNANINAPNLNNLNPIEIDIPQVTTDISAIPALGSIAALGLGNMFDRNPHVMTRKTTVTKVETDKKKKGFVQEEKGESVEYTHREGTENNKELDSIKNYRPFVESIVRRNLTFGHNGQIYTRNTSLERHFGRALQILDESNLEYTFDNMIDVLTEQLEKRIAINKERMDKLGQSQGIEIEILRPINITFNRQDDGISTRREWQEWLDRYSGRGYQGSTEHDDWNETKKFGIPEDTEESKYQTYEMSPRPSRSASEMGTIVSMLTYAGFLDKEMIDTKGEREIYSLHISTSFPEEITSNPEFENTYTQVASIMSLGFASLQRLGFESYKQGGDIIAVKSNANLTRSRTRPSTALEPLTQKQREEMDRGVMSITEMRGFDVNNDTPSLIINKNYVDALVRMHFEGNQEATEILNNFISQSREIVKDLGMDESDYQTYINNPSHTRLVAETLKDLDEGQLNEFRNRIRKEIRNIRSEMKNRDLIDDDL